jgi:hypothetical protein
MKAKRLMSEVAGVMADVLVHQRARWGRCSRINASSRAGGRPRWSRRSRAGAGAFATIGTSRRTRSEPSRRASDLVVAPWQSEVQDFDYGARPRVWIELKQRATWWGMTPGATAKAFGSDLEKWKGVTGEGEVVLVCQISLHDGTESETLPASWQEELDSLAKQYEHATMPRIVGYEIAPSRRDVRTGGTASEQRVRWARFDAFVVNRGW